MIATRYSQWLNCFTTQNTDKMATANRSGLEDLTGFSEVELPSAELQATATVSPQEVQLRNF